MTRTAAEVLMDAVTPEELLQHRHLTEAERSLFWQRKWHQAAMIESLEREIAAEQADRRLVKFIARCTVFFGSVLAVGMAAAWVVIK